MIRYIALGLLFFPAWAGQPRMGLPLDCTLGKTCWISNYVNHGIPGNPLDYQCGSMTYDTHNGTDFALESKAAMDGRVKVLASDTGVVKALRADENDFVLVQQGPKAVANKECGNGVVLDHGEGWETQYCHLKKRSIKVKVGQKILKGDPLGLVGESGLSEYPHVHVTVRHRGKIIDPFAGKLIEGQCSKDPVSLWDQDIPYVPGVVYHLGIAGEAPNLKSVQSGKVYPPILVDSPILLGYMTLFGVVKGDVFGGEILDPQGSIFANFTHTFKETQAHYFQYFGKQRGEAKLTPGTWILRVYYISQKLNKRTSYEKQFTVN